MNYIVWLLAGGVLGWLTTKFLRSRRTNLLSNIAVGIVGAFIAGYYVAPMLHINTINQVIFSVPALLVALIGAVILLAITNILRGKNDMKNGVIERKWEQVRIKIHTRWGRLTDQDIAKINGNHNQFIITLQERYGISKKEAVDQLQRFVNAVL